MGHQPSAHDLWFLPLGGSNEIGMNLNLYGHDGQWLMVDCGITFHDRLGIDILTPDIDFIEKNRASLIGLVITHAHEDHVGAVPYLWPQLKCPIYATPFTATILREKLRDKPWRKQVEIIEIPLSGSCQIGHFGIEFVTLTHSIPEPNALYIKTPLGNIFHSGDWKIDPDPLVGDATHEQRLKEIGDAGVLALVCDSTNVFTDGVSGSEKGVRDELIKLIQNHPTGRIFVGCFASNVARLETAAVAALANKRQPVLVGRSLWRMYEAARENGYLKDLPPFLSEEQGMKMRPEDVLFIATGSQGEPRAALWRIASQQHPVVHIDEGDTVIFSSRMIPGNEKSIAALQNRLVLQGVKVITAHEEEIHVSGHPARDELKQMYEWIRPEILVPVHGEARHLQEHATYGLECGIHKAVIPENGSLIHLAPGTPKVLNMIPVGRLAYDGNRLLPLQSPVLRERAQLSIQGCIFVTVSAASKSKGNHKADRRVTVSHHGITQPGDESDDLTSDIIRTVTGTLSHDSRDLKAQTESVKKAVRQLANARFSKKPIVEVHLLD